MCDFYPDIDLDSQSKCSGSESFEKIFGYIGGLIQKDPKISTSDVYNNLVMDGLIDPNSSELPINFSQAKMLDNRFFSGKGGGYWLSAYLRPNQNEIFKFDGTYYQAFDCGIFTFSYKEVKNFLVWKCHDSNVNTQNPVEKIFVQNDNLDLSILPDDEFDCHCVNVSKFIRSKQEPNWELTQDLTQDLVKELTQDLTQDLAQDLTQDLVNDLVNDLVKDLVKDPTHNDEHDDYEYDVFDERESIEETKNILSRSKKIADKIFEFVSTWLVENSGSGSGYGSGSESESESEPKPCELFEIVKNHFPELVNSRSLCFVDAYELDKKIFGKGGGFWRSAFDNPKQSDIIEINGKKYNADKVGMFTFSVWP
jgi:hypothetical protein